MSDLPNHFGEAVAAEYDGDERFAPEHLELETGFLADVPVAIGDFASTVVGADFDLAYLVYNTIGNVTTQDAQVATFENAARHLRPGGCFVVETSVPGLMLAQTDHRYAVFDHAEDVG